MKKILLPVFIFFNCKILPAQAPDILWEQSFGGTSTDESWAVQQTEDGGYILAGTSYSDDVDLDGNYGSRDYCLVKTDSNGNAEWVKHYGSSNIDYCYDAVCAFDGGYLLAGYTFGNDFDVSELNGPSDIWLVKVDNDGEIEWERSYGGSMGEHSEGVIKTKDSCYVIVGHTGSNDFDVSGSHGSDTWVVKIDREGEIIWQTCLGGSAAEFGYGICQTEDGGYAVASYSLSDDGQVGLNHGSVDYWLAKLDSLGNFEWGHVYGGSQLDWCQSVKQTSDNGYILAGYSGSHNGDVTVNYGFYDYWIVKTDSIGNLQWQKSYGGSINDEAYDIIICSDGGYLICGHTTSSDGDVSGFHGPSIFADLWLIKIDDEGNLLWQKAMGGTSTDNGTTILEVSDGNYIAGGLSASNNGDVTENIGAKDFWLVKLGECIEAAYYADMDGDGYGDIGLDSIACELPIGYVADSTDCDDTNENIYPGAEDICNAIDDNCNGEIDEDALFITYYADTDGDAFGDVFADSSSCFVPVGFVLDNTDCDDTNENIYPGATEVCNFLDDDCDGYIDDNLAFVWLYQDADNDNYGNATMDTLTCETLTGYVPDSTDCDDTNPDIYPGAPEVLNGLDDDCDGVADEGLAVEENTSPKISLYPNPAQSAITLLFSSIKNEPVQAEIRNNIGERIRDIQINNVATEVDISVLADGVYFVVITIGDDKYVLSFVKTE